MSVEEAVFPNSGHNSASLGASVAGPGSAQKLLGFGSWVCVGARGGPPFPSVHAHSTSIPAHRACWEPHAFSTARVHGVSGTTGQMQRDVTPGPVLGVRTKAWPALPARGPLIWQPSPRNRRPQVQPTSGILGCADLVLGFHPAHSRLALPSRHVRVVRTPCILSLTHQHAHTDTSTFMRMQTCATQVS